MSRAGPLSGRATVASKTTFEALAVDSGEESEEEQVIAQPTPPPESAPPKPSKSALKKAAKTARTEKRQQLKAAKTRMSDNSQEESSASGSPRRPPATFEPVKVIHESYEIIPDNLNDTSQEVPAKEPPQAAVQADNDIPNNDDVLSSPDPSYPTSMEASGRNSPEPLVGLITENVLQGDALDAELQLALQNKQQEAERTKRKQNAVTRTIWGFAMIGGFIGAALMHTLVSFNTHGHIHL
jgi:phosphatidate cytidylyltransferase